MLAASKRKGSRVPVSWLSCLGTGPAKQPQQGDTGVSRSHVSVIGRAVMTQEAVSNVLTLP